MLKKIVEWGKSETLIKALVLLGSRAGRQPIDSFSDYDISVFCDSDVPYTESKTWMSQFGNVWVFVKEKVFFKGKSFPSRLVIFEGGVKAMIAKFGWISGRRPEIQPNFAIICFMFMQLFSSI